MDCGEIWCVLETHYLGVLQKSRVGHWGIHARANVRTISHISGKAGRTALKFIVWLGDNYLWVLRKSGVGTSARAQVSTPFPFLGKG